MVKCINYKEIVTLTVIGECIVGLLPHEDGYFFSKNTLELCWNWIEEQEIEIGDLYDCLDSPEEIDFSYYEDMAENEKEQSIYRHLFNIVAYITYKISIMQKINRPQYLDYITEDFFEVIIKEITVEWGYIKEVADKALEYCDENILPIMHENIMREVVNRER